MKKIVMFKPVNIYLEQVYFMSLLNYSQGTTTPIEIAADLRAVKNSIVLVDGIRLTPVTISQLKNNGNTICSFDINDHSSFDSMYGQSKEILDIDLIFKVAGIQEVQSSDEMYIDNNMHITKRLRPFCSDEHWQTYSTIKNSGRLHSLPYVMWRDPDIVPSLTWEGRKKLCLVRGGHHYQRFIMYLHFLKHHLVDEFSCFFTTHYVHQYCDDCRKIWKEHGGMSLAHYRGSKTSCRIPSPIPDDYFNGQTTGKAHWNNQCVPFFYEAAEIFKKHHGDINLGLLEGALNSSPLADANLYNILKQYLFYCDYKWAFSILAPPRFWEAAAMKTINLYPRRINDQSFFPEMKDGEHYLTFSEDFSDLKDATNITKEQYEYISSNCFELYGKWIKGNQHKLSVFLINHILDKVRDNR